MKPVETPMMDEDVLQCSMRSRHGWIDGNSVMRNGKRGDDDDVMYAYM